jgi:hypothetical protein
VAVRKTKVKPVIQEKTEERKKEEKCCCYDSKWVSAGWVLLLLGGLAHMLPEQMAPIMKWSLFGISLQLAIGVVSVVMALNFLLEE